MQSANFISKKVRSVAMTLPRTWHVLGERLFVERFSTVLPRFGVDSKLKWNMKHSVKHWFYIQTFQELCSIFGKCLDVSKISLDKETQTKNILYYHNKHFIVKPMVLFTLSLMNRLVRVLLLSSVWLILHHCRNEK